MIRIISGYFPSFLLLTIAATISQPTISQPTISSTAQQVARNPVTKLPKPPSSLPITEVHLWVAPQASPWEMGRLTVPDTDTTIVTQPGSPDDSEALAPVDEDSATRLIAPTSNRPPLAPGS